MTPRVISSVTITNPPRNSHKIFKISEEPRSLNCIFLPKGAADIFANLKHCLPIGIPIIVIDQRIPITIHENQLINPPKTNHIIFPNNFKKISPFYTIVIYIIRENA